MKKSVIILAGALAFDLGVMVVGGQAAEGPAGPQAGPAPAATGYIKLDGLKGEVAGQPLAWKLDKANTAKACFQKFGKVVDTPQGKFCQLPKAPTAK